MTNFIPNTPDSLLTRERTAQALTEAGFPVRAKTLATKASRGGGPPYRKFGLRVLYRWGDALAWAEGRLTAPCCSTSEQDIGGQQRFETVPRSPTSRIRLAAGGPPAGRQS
jgi:hypothetical protein